MTGHEPRGRSLGRVFRSGDGCHWYDTAVNGLYRVDPVLADVLEVFDGGNDGEVRLRLAGVHAEAELARAVAEIRQARRDEGLFAPLGPPPAAPETGSGRAGGAPAIAHLTLGLTDHCNLRCGYCPLTRMPAAGRRDMSVATALRAAAWFTERCGGSGPANISFYGGEPLLRLDLIGEVVAAVRRHQGGRTIDFTVDTNATLIDDRTARFLATEGIRLQVSLDGPPHIHDRHRRGGHGAPTHARIEAGLRRLLRVDAAMAQRIRFVATLTPPYEILEISDYFARFPLYRELGLDAEPTVRLNFAGLEGTGLAEGDGRAAAAEQWRSAMAAARERYKAALAAGRRATLPRALAGLFDDPLVRWHHRSRGACGDTYFPAGACRPGVRRVYVDPDGRLLPCERAGAERAIGDVDRGFDAEAIAAVHRELLDVVAGRCRTCWAQRLCRICFTSVRPDLPRPAARARAARECAGILVEVESSLRLYLDINQHETGALAFLERTAMA